MDEDSFFELLSRFQSKRMDDQRCTLSLDPTGNKENKEPRPRPASSPIVLPPANGSINNSENSASGKRYKYNFFLP